MGHKNWNSIDKKIIYQASTPDEISFIQEKISLSNGHQFNYVHVDCPYEVVYVVGIDDYNNVLLIQQYRYLFKESIIEVPAGSPEGEETLEEGAKREFEEEAGYIANRIIYLGGFYPSTGITNQKCHMYLALNLEKTEQKLEISEDIVVQWTPLQDAVNMVYTGKIKNVGAALGLLMAQNWILNSSKQ